MCTETIKIVDFLNNNHQFSVSFEVTPEVNEDDFRTINLQPVFYSVTWHAMSHQCKDMEIAPLKLANFLRQSGKNVLLHLTCTLMKTEYLNTLLLWLKEKGICNLFIVLGEAFDRELSDFSTTQEMIAYVRKTTGSYFCIGVAGFPGCKSKVSVLKQKVEQGADFIISQAFFELNDFKQFVNDCYDAGIKVPIIPGLFPFQSQKELNGFLKLCKVKVNADFHFKNNSSMFNRTNVIEDLIIQLYNNMDVRHFHFFTLNKFSRTCDLIGKIRY